MQFKFFKFYIIKILVTFLTFHNLNLARPKHSASRDGQNHQILAIFESKSPYLGYIKIKIIHVNDLKIKII